VLAGQRPEHDVEQDRRVEELAERRQHQHGNQPVGALGDADLGLHAETLGPSPRVRRHRAHHQAVQRHRGEDVAPDVAEVQHQPTEDRGVADPVEGRVEERPQRDDRPTCVPCSRR
jgi:hypothetical protein